MNTDSLLAITRNLELLEVGRKAIEDTLLALRDSRISAFRNNGLVCKERDGSDSHIIRLGPEHAIQIGLKAIAVYLNEHPEIKI
jgi:hypothetical protein